MHCGHYYTVLTFPHALLPFLASYDSQPHGYQSILDISLTLTCIDCQWRKPKWLQNDQCSGIPANNFGANAGITSFCFCAHWGPLSTILSRLGDTFILIGSLFLSVNIQYTPIGKPLSVCIVHFSFKSSSGHIVNKISIHLKLYSHKCQVALSIISLMIHRGVYCNVFLNI